MFSSPGTENQPDFIPESPLDHPGMYGQRDVPGRGSPPPQSTRRWDSVAKFSLLAIGLFVVLLPWTADYMIEQYHLAATRGRLEAEYEFAVKHMANDSSSWRDLSLGSQRVFQKVRPSVVSIQTYSRDGVFRGDSQGSGFVISKDGFIVTNNHVVDGANQIFVAIEGRRDVQAKLIGTDELTDLAVIKIPANDLTPVEWSDSDQVQIGALVWAIGSPFGLQNSISQGIISGTQRRGDTSYQEFLQTDAAVNPGNSGGPLVDENGRVLGVNTLIYGQRFQGISFAVPSNLVREVCRQLQANGKFIRGFLGVLPEPIFEDDVQRLGLPDAQGALLAQVVPGTPADRAGLKPNDVIRQWNGQIIHNERALFRYIGMTPPDSSADVSFIRNGNEETVRVRVTRQPKR